MTKLTIDIVSDLVCPWCFIGTRRLELALEAFPDVEAELNYHPFLLDPNTPPEGVDLRANLRRKYNADPERMFGQVEQAARDSGIPLDFSKVRLSVNTIKAHALSETAAEHGAQRALIKALFSAYFLDGQNIGDDAVLVQLGKAAGLSEDDAKAAISSPDLLASVRSQAQDASRQGISGVPFTILDGRFALSGAQPVEVFRGAIERALAGRAEGSSGNQR